MPRGKARVAGSNYTVLQWRGGSIAFLEGFNDSGVTPVAQVEEIHPLGSPHPVEYATPNALRGGTLTFSIREVWEKPVWQHFTGLQEANNLLDVWGAMNSDSTSVTCLMIIKIPGATQWRTKTFHNVVISAIDDSEAFTIGSMTIPRQVRAQYTHSTPGKISATA